MEKRTYSKETHAKNFEWEVTPEDTVSITEYTGKAKRVVIPKKIEGRVVTSISREAFSICTSLTSIKVPSSVTAIGSWAFYGCRSVVGVEIPDSVRDIGRYAFEGCTNLTIICRAGTYAHKYAQKNGINFELRQ